MCDSRHTLWRCDRAIITKTSNSMGPEMKSLTKEERRVVARRIFEALCVHYPDRYVALIEQPGSAEPTAASAKVMQNATMIADSDGPK